MEQTTDNKCLIPSSDTIQEKGHVVVLTGPSGVGKSSLLTLLTERFVVDTFPTYTTRQSRHTNQDETEYIFRALSEFPKGEGILLFRKYDATYGLWLNAVDDSLKHGRIHVLILGCYKSIRILQERYGSYLTTTLVYCALETLQERFRRKVLSSRENRGERWRSVKEEIAEMYHNLGVIQHIVDNSGTIEKSFASLSQILSSLGAKRRE